MIDISGKKTTRRIARAVGRIVLSPAIYQELTRKGSPKGDVMETARMAGLLAAKQTPGLIPHCHPILLEKVSVTLDLCPQEHAVSVLAEVVSTGKTGVEMEALATVAGACLTIYDMMKFAGHEMKIEGIEVVAKRGGQRDYDQSLDAVDRL